MSWRRTAFLALLLAPLAVSPAADAAPGPPVAQCSPAPADCSGWFRTNVTVSWSYDQNGLTETQGCNVRTITADTAGSAQTCQVSYGSDTYGRTVTIRRDATPPQVTSAAAERAPDAGGWYNHPVAVVLSGTDATSGIASCDRPSYGGGDSDAAALSGVCRDVAGNVSAPASATIKYDATPPSAAAEPDRKADTNGWYRRPVTVAFTATDGASGVESCAAPARYAGPDAAEARVAGACRDRAGNSAEAALTLRYDATAPKPSTATARGAGKTARVTWRKPADAVLVSIDRTPGVNGRARTNVYRGSGELFVDRTVRRGVRYTYEILFVDVAGNAAAKKVTFGGAGPALHTPAAGAVVRGPVALAWQPAPGARFYNVQLYRNGVKILTAWPGGTSFRVPTRWRFGGRPQTLAPGTYRWLVWPAFGTRATPKYGRLLGTSTFRVK